MESMEHKNVQLNALQLQKNELKQDLFTLQSELKGVPDNHVMIIICGLTNAFEKSFLSSCFSQEKEIIQTRF